MDFVKHLPGITQFLSIALIFTFCGLRASAVEQATKPAAGYFSWRSLFPWMRSRATQPSSQPNKTLSGEIQNTGLFPTAISGLIGQYAQEYGPYTKIATIQKPGTLLGISDDEEGTTVTSAGFETNDLLTVTRYNVNTSTVSGFEIQQVKREPLLLSGNGKVLITPDKNQFIDTVTGAPISLLSEQDRKFSGILAILPPPITFLEHGWEPILLNYDGTTAAGTNLHRILFYNFKKKKGVWLETDDDLSDVAESRLSQDEKTFAYLLSSNWPNFSFIRIFNTNDGKLKDSYQSRLPWSIVSFDINHDGSQLFYIAHNRDTKSDRAVLVNLYPKYPRQEKEIFNTYGTVGRIYKGGFSGLDNLYVASMIKQRTFFRGASLKNFIRIYNLETSKVEEIPLQGSYEPNLSFNREGTVLAVGSSEDVEIFKRSTKTEEVQAKLEKKRTERREAEVKKDTEGFEQQRRLQLQKQPLSSGAPSGLSAAIMQHITRKNLQPPNQEAYNIRRGAIQKRISAAGAVHKLRLPVENVD